jgi:hypothetical protein
MKIQLSVLVYYKANLSIISLKGLKPMIYPPRSEHDNHYTMRVNTLGLILLDKLILVLSDRLNDILFVEAYLISKGYTHL